jgi:hypothetical protein
MSDPLPSGFPPPEPLHPDAIYTADEVARIVFRQYRQWFYRHRVALMREENFPRPISKYGLPRWRGYDLIQWLARDKTTNQAVGTNFENILRLRTQNLRRKA